MAGLGGIVALLVKNAVKSAVKFELAVDPIIAKLSNQCPPREELDRIVNQKNQLSQALTQIETSLSSLSSTGSTIDGIVTGINVGVTVLKALPVPTSVPPGVGIPLNIINGFSDTLDVLGVLLKEFGGVTSQIAPSVQIITSTVATVNSKLSTLDGLIAGCLSSETEGMSDLEKEKFFENLGIDLSSPDPTGGGDTNSGETLEDRLSLNSKNPIVYKGYTIILDSEAGNKFSFPSRRAIGTNDEGVKIVTPFSYSSSTQVLLDTIKFQIDQLNSIELATLTRESKVESLRISEQAAIAKTNADKYYELYIEQTKNLPNLRRGILDSLNNAYNLVVQGYKLLLSITPDDFYPKDRLFQLERMQNRLVKKYTINIGSIVGASQQANATSNAPINYDPFTGPGQQGEVKFLGSQAYKYSNTPSKKWSKTVVDLSPFNIAGFNSNSIKETTRFENSGGDRYKVITQYKWNVLKYRWEQFNVFRFPVVR